ncbi:MAG: NDP-sugar synthase [Patescibacteria group bacterium]
MIILINISVSTSKGDRSLFNQQGYKTIDKLDVILLCGGKGQRLKNVTELPKSLYQINSKELIKYSLDLLDSRLLKKLIFALGYKSEVMTKWISENIKHDSFTIVKEQSEGILQAVVKCFKFTQTEDILICNTDEIRLGLDFCNMLEFHRAHKKTATMASTVCDKLYRHRLLEIRQDNTLLSSRLKPKQFENRPTISDSVNIGFLIFNRRFIEYINPNLSLGWSGIIDPLVKAREIKVYRSKNTSYFNVGTPKEVKEATIFLEQNSADT